MALKAKDMIYVRSWVGSGPTDQELNERWSRFRNRDAVVEETLRVMITAMSESPIDRVSLPNGLSFSMKENVALLERKLNDFRSRGSVGITELSRRDYR